MSKYSKMPRVPQDAYQTPEWPVQVVVPHLIGVKKFAEPCFGEGKLVRWLETAGLTCTHFGDIKTGQDALTDPTLATVRFDAIITNPPYTEKLLYALLRRFMSIAPTWLLLEADFLHKVGAAELIAHCSLIVSVGRIKWFEGTRDESKSNYAWYRFDAQHTTGPRFIPRIAKPRPPRAPRKKIPAPAPETPEDIAA